MRVALVPWWEHQHTYYECEDGVTVGDMLDALGDPDDRVTKPRWFTGTHNLQCEPRERLLTQVLQQSRQGNYYIFEVSVDGREQATELEQKRQHKNERRRVHYQSQKRKWLREAK